jgi:hypothetical protein
MKVKLPAGVALSRWMSKKIGGDLEQTIILGENAPHPELRYVDGGVVEVWPDGVVKFISCGREIELSFQDKDLDVWGARQLLLAVLPDILPEDEEVAVLLGRKLMWRIVVNRIRHFDGTAAFEDADLFLEEPRRRVARLTNRRAVAAVREALTELGWPHRESWIAPW